eukprot:1153871-Pelagomonas_calceolata.AAC.5
MTSCKHSTSLHPGHNEQLALMDDDTQLCTLQGPCQGLQGSAKQREPRGLPAGMSMMELRMPSSGKGSPIAQPEFEGPADYIFCVGHAHSTALEQGNISTAPANRVRSFECSQTGKHYQVAVPEPIKRKEELELLSIKEVTAAG